ncbi:heme-binding protein [Glaciimonas sp. GS1]|uniref:Heme-binding protein n=2 Tax=Glaciimonas soli TaxID=2590999 RepID=A0A843YQ84_9BURK|nr:heme-binding protein [Glaciimonas soli]
MQIPNRLTKFLLAPICALLCTMVVPNTATAASNPADPNKVIHWAVEAPDDGLDMVKTVNYYSGVFAESIFETLLTYDYLARPAKLIPGTAEAMPEVSNSGRTYVIHIKKGIYFAPDPAFKGVRRELTAQDYAYTFKRFVDPQNRSPAAGLLEGKIVGMDALEKQAKKTGKFDYDAPVEGLQTPDRYTLRITLNQPDYDFLYVLAFTAYGAQAREAVDFYGALTNVHPVGTGPYMLSQYVPRSKIVLVANPEYRGFTWDFKSSGGEDAAYDKQLIKDMQGKKMPQVGRVEINIIEEEQSRWLAFQGKQLDFDKLPESVAPKVMNGTALKPEFTDQNIGLYRQAEPELTYTYFNYHDPVVGGTSLEKNALRRAIAMSYNTRQEISLIRNNQAAEAQMMIPVGVVGHDPDYRRSYGYDIDLANKLLDHFGYKRGADGYRTTPDGKPLMIKIASQPSAKDQSYAEIWKQGLDKIGIRVDFVVSNFADNLKAATECKLMIWNSAWIADFPEGDNFMQLLYGPNTGQGNNGCYTSDAFDALYVKARATPPGPERNAIYLQMNRQMEADTAVLTQVSRTRSWLIRPWVKGFKQHPILHQNWQYLDVEKH